MEQENVISMEQVLTQPACPEHLETQTFYQQEADLVQSDNENCRKKANTGHESRNAWAMADAATLQRAWKISLRLPSVVGGRLRKSSHQCSCLTERFCIQKGEHEVFLFRPTLVFLNTNLKMLGNDTRACTSLSLGRMRIEKKG